ncbi:hypothetical protein H2204_001418 [Knufia peltigerae]|uniref:Uncharacterized protein n=1 Tax=Knufia peltigerae TaxID=1002370 RepID=A0AA39D3J2_9EURO|nr:hypothetical protein H2204_001418 [Knufia peltigerae]
MASSNLHPPPQSDLFYESDMSDWGGNEYNNYHGHSSSAASQQQHRRSSESSTERSLYDDDKEKYSTNNDAGGGGINPVQQYQQEYGFYYPQLLSRGLVVLTNNNTFGSDPKQPLFYAEMSQFTFHKPDVTLHALPPGGCSSIAANGQDVDLDLEHVAEMGESAPVVGAVHLPKLSRNFTLEIGGDQFSYAPDTSIEVTCASMITHSEYRLEFNGRSFAWKRTHDEQAGVEGGSFLRALNMESYQLIDIEADEVVASFLANKFKSWKKKGKLRMADLRIGPDTQKLRLVIFLSITGILEKARRREARRNRRRRAAA